MKILVVLLSCLLLFNCAAKPGTSELKTVKSAVIALDLRSDIHPKVLSFVKEHYALRSYRPMWGNLDTLREANYLKPLQAASHHGLNPNFYFYHELISLALASRNSYQTAEFDVLLTTAYLSFAKDLALGRFDPSLMQPEWHIEQADQWQHLAQFPTIIWPEKISTFAPSSNEYQLMSKQLAKLELFSSTNELLYLHFQANESQLAIERLSDWLNAMDYQHEHTGYQYDTSLQDAIKALQKKHNLIADGKWGPNTAKTLYGETMQRISTIKANLERIRWMPNKLPQTRVWVDITGFSAAIHSHSGDFKTTAIMGRPDRKTRIFDDELTHFVINPIWRVPNRIAREDLLPRFQRDSSYITNHHYQVFASWSATTPLNSHEIDWNQFNEKYFPLRIEQLPSASNSLGKYKFMFPNKYGIYLHDTPQKELFKRLDLAHSSGCGRLMEPQLFAYKLLEVDQQTNKDIQSSQTKTIHLKTRIPVYLTYFTIWPDHTGRLIPRNDLYNQDAALIAAFS